MEPEIKCFHFIRTTKEKIVITEDVDGNDLLVKITEHICRICLERVGLIYAVIERKAKKGN